MADTLEDVKARLRRDFLGRGGIHALGINRNRKAINVYVGPEASAEEPAVLDELRKRAEPFAIIVLREPPPRLS